MLGIPRSLGCVCTLQSKELSYEDPDPTSALVQDPRRQAHLRRGCQPGQPRGRRHVRRRRCRHRVPWSPAADPADPVLHDAGQPGLQQGGSVSRAHHGPGQQRHVRRDVPGGAQGPDAQQALVQLRRRDQLPPGQGQQRVRPGLHPRHRADVRPDDGRSARRRRVPRSDHFPGGLVPGLHEGPQPVRHGVDHLHRER